MHAYMHAYIHTHIGGCEYEYKHHVVFTHAPLHLGVYNCM